MSSFAEEMNRAATATTMFGYYDGILFRVFSGSVEGIIVEFPRGARGFGWDAIVPTAGQRTDICGNGAEEKDHFSMRRLALEQLRQSDC